MKRPEIRTLYKYFRVSNEVLDSLRTGAFWFAKPASFNDPFDCGICIAEDALQESVTHTLERLTAEPGYEAGSIPPERWIATDDDRAAFNEFRVGLSKMASELGVLCLAEAADNLLMWAHYGDSHRGICVGFKRDENSTFGHQAEPVQYKKAYPRLTVADFEPRTHPDSFAHLWLTKAADWEYEREWRVCQDRGDRLYAVDAPIETVVFGARISDKDRSAVLDALKRGKRSPCLAQARTSTTGFRLELEAWSG